MFPLEYLENKNVKRFLGNKGETRVPTLRRKTELCGYSCGTWTFAHPTSNLNFFLHLVSARYYCQQLDADNFKITPDEKVEILHARLLNAT